MYGEDNASFQNDTREEGATKSSITLNDIELNSLPSENATGQNIKTVRVCLDNNSRNVESQIDKDESADENLVYFLDDTSPITCSTLFSKYTSEFSHSFSFSVKLAFLLYCVIPIVFYIDLGLNYTTKRNIFDESSSKPHAILRWQAILFALPPTVYFLILLLYPLPTIFLRPKDFLVNGKCWACDGCDLLLGEEVLKHMEKMQEQIYKSTTGLIERHKKCLVGLLNYRGSCNLIDDACIKRCCFPFSECLWSVIVVAFFGIFIGAISFCAFLVVSILRGCCYSPLFCFIIVLSRKIGEKPYFCTHRDKLVSFYLSCLLVLVSIIGASSCRFLVRMFAFIIMGLIFNVEIAGPFVTFLLAATTNVYLCFYNLQMRYQDVKQMISQKWQEQIGDNTDVLTDTDTIPARLFWYICGGESKSDHEHKVLPVIPEIIRMFLNMALISIFLFLSWCSIIFLGNTYNISAVVATIAVFVSGVIPRFFFKGLTKEKRFSGPTRKRMIKNIEKTVKDYIVMVRADRWVTQGEIM